MTATAWRQTDPRPTGAADDWRAHAACTGTDPALWFPDLGENAHDAKTICNACPVKDACLDYALTTHQPHGIRGGLSPIERRALTTTERTPAPCGTTAAYWAHRRRRETPCDACRAAYNAHRKPRGQR